ncbi:hypothetical protein [Kitasatospora sp. GP82]|uniref:hypothetical protein n=1 Tax=Kitasatospora sp. GP82 TaxID=3035089 RepID=UPI002472EC92|nr:hypothetical protein [Kitasatospora sp. GP82]MDH6127140.1 hypothetical protein [Kitasatospora sp. GP82]
MYDQATREHAVALHRSGPTFSEVSRSTGVSRFAIREWTSRITPSSRMTAIVLTSWRQRIVDAHPWELLRGLIHSDGCRITNWATRAVGGVLKRYEYPRYFFTDTSTDIVRILTGALEAVGVEWKAVNRPSGAVNVSIARRASVALMDAHIGPKH